MIRFNMLLTGANIDPATTRLVRHRHRTHQRQMYQDAIGRDARFDQYQSVQVNPRVIDQITSASMIASFVVDPGGDTVFIGMWKVNGLNDQPTRDPYNPGPPTTGRRRVFLDLRRSRYLDEYCGRIVVEWGASRAWLQYAERRDKPIIELRRQAEEPRFPGVRALCMRPNEVAALPPAWSETLRATRGVYLLIHRDSGAMYVGSATGTNGLLGRWTDYANGHGGTVSLKRLARPASEYDVRILETAGSGASVEEILEVEYLWQAKLGARVINLGPT